MTILQELIRSRNAIANKNDWCQHSLTNSDGGGHMQVCALGAIYGLNEDNRIPESTERMKMINMTCDVLSAICAELWPSGAQLRLSHIQDLNAVGLDWIENTASARGSITVVNDTLGHAAVLAAFDLAIAREAAKEVTMTEKAPGETIAPTEILKKAA